MRAKTISITRPKPKAWHSVVVLVLAASAMAIPATASAVPIESGPYSSVNATSGGSDRSSHRPYGGGHVAPSGQPTIGRPNEGTVALDPLPYTGSPLVDTIQPTIARPNEGIVTADHLHYTGPTPLDTSQPVASSDGFDWASAGIGAGAAMALVALGGAALLTVRRRAAASPSAAS
jgi:hypothetical protein